MFTIKKDNIEIVKLLLENGRVNPNNYSYEELKNSDNFKEDFKTLFSTSPEKQNKPS